MCVPDAWALAVQVSCALEPRPGRVGRAGPLCVCLTCGHFGFHACRELFVRRDTRIFAYAPFEASLDATKVKTSKGKAFNRFRSLWNRHAIMDFTLTANA